MKLIIFSFLWQCFSKRAEGASEAKASSPFKGNFHLIEAMLWADDMMKDEKGREVNYAEGAKLGLPTMMFDPVRGSLNARSAWNKDAVAMQFECRVDSVGASHDHSDRGNFTLFAHGRSWAKDNFRSVETRHHNNVLIDGFGQGYWPGPGRWVSHSEMGNLVFASVDAKDCYGWWWPKQIKNEKQDFIRFRYPRWQSYAGEAALFQKEYEGTPIERDTRPAVAAFWEGFGKTDPRLWDEDSWPVRLPHNPVQRAFRSVVFHKGKHPWLLVVDDIQKDGQERLYEWLMQTGMDTEMVSMSGNDIILADATTKRNAEGELEPAPGDRQLLVRILHLEDPADPHHFTSRPSCRLETFERKDTLLPTAAEGALTGSRSFGLDKRLVLASRSVAPNFRILLFPHRHGEALPTTVWNGDRSECIIETAGERSRLKFTTNGNGLTVISHLP
ncbi:MAG: hypothetical protein MUF13_15615, partial [Akkermansiaceae bacterium]|nr:hypothetical protein [Akkermansiaceae bacterium]